MTQYHRIPAVFFSLAASFLLGGCVGLDSCYNEPYYPAGRGYGYAYSQACYDNSYYDSGPSYNNRNCDNGSYYNQGPPPSQSQPSSPPPQSAPASPPPPPSQPAPPPPGSTSFPQSGGQIGRPPAQQIQTPNKGNSNYPPT